MAGADGKETMDDTTFETFRQWVGRRREEHDTVTGWPVKAMSATLERPGRAPEYGDEVPPAWHWLYFLEARPASQIGSDGHPQRGDFLPPVPLPRRMWAGGRIEWHAPLRVGDAATRLSEIVSVEPKSGRTGTLVFVTVRHTISVAGGVSIVEEHDIVYREAAKPGDPVPPPRPGPDGPTWTRTCIPDEVMLFRYSALTFNGHRIHYDAPYVTGTEGYPGLVVHGPLQATLLLDLAREHAPGGRRLARFEYRALSPTFGGRPLALNGIVHADGRSAQVWAAGPGSGQTMASTVSFD
jgi:3-methylfumaryl-CoA hydratase